MLCVEWRNMVRSAIPDTIVELTDSTENFRNAMVEGGALKLILKMLESRKDYVRETAAGALGGMAGHRAIIHPCTIVELTDSTENFQSTMIQADTIELMVKMLQSQDDNVQWSAVDALGRMAEHGAISHPLMIVELTDSAQTISAVLWTKGVL